MDNHGTLDWVDGHLDLAYLAVGGRNMEAQPPAGGALSLPALAEGGVRIVLGTIFVQRRVTGHGDKDVDGAWCFGSPDEAHAACARQIEIYHQWETAGRAEIVRSRTALPMPHPSLPTTQDHRTRPLQIVLLLEGASGIRRPDDLHAFHAAGLRAVGLAWAEGNAWAGGNNVGGGLTAQGRGLLAQIDALRMIHDVSHLAEAGFWDVMELAKGPRMASHSNCRELLKGRGGNLERHLSDKQIEALAHAGAMIGINLYGWFLVDNGRATLADVVKHILHTADVMGRRDLIGLGSDMDGGFGSASLPAGLDHPRQLGRLADALAEAGWNQDEVAGFAGANWRHFLNRALRD